MRQNLKLRTYDELNKCVISHMKEKLNSELEIKSYKFISDFKSIGSPTTHELNVLTNKGLFKFSVDSFNSFFKETESSEKLGFYELFNAVDFQVENFDTENEVDRISPGLQKLRNKHFQAEFEKQTRETERRMKW